MLKDVQVRDVIIASAAHTNSSVASLMVPYATVALAPSPYLLRAAMNAAETHEGLRWHVGPVYASDHFYAATPGTVDKLIDLGTLAVEMEAAGLYAVALSEGKEALTVLTVSDHLTAESPELTSAEREDCYRSMVAIAAAALRS
jgi:purine-nucleoside phosphorylase